MNQGLLRGPIEGHASFVEASAVLGELIDKHPDPPEYRRDYAVCLRTLALMQYGRKEHDAAIESYRRALSLNPNDADMHSDYADAMVHSGENETAIEHLQRAMRLNPYFPDQYLWHLGGAYYNLKRYEDVIETVNKMNNPTEGQRLLAASYAQIGNTDMARMIADKHRAAHPNFSLKHWAKIQPDRLEDDTQLLVEGLKKAGF